MIVLRFLFILILSGFIPSAEAAPSDSSNFFDDYYFNVFPENKDAWPYFGGQGDSLGDLGFWKFFPHILPSEMKPKEQRAHLLQVAKEALGLRQNGFDLFLQMRLLTELGREIDEEFKASVSISSPTCEVSIENGNSENSTPLNEGSLSEVGNAYRRLCHTIHEDQHLRIRGDNGDLFRRYEALDSRTSRYALEGRRLMESPIPMSEVRTALAKMNGELESPEEVLDWMEEFETVLNEIYLVTQTRPDWNSTNPPHSDSRVFNCYPLLALEGIEKGVAPIANYFDVGKEIHFNMDYNPMATDMIKQWPAYPQPREIVARIGWGILLQAENSSGGKMKGDPLNLPMIFTGRYLRRQLVEQFGEKWGAALADRREEYEKRIHDFVSSRDYTPRSTDIWEGADLPRPFGLSEQAYLEHVVYALAKLDYFDEIVMPSIERNTLSPAQMKEIRLLAEKIRPLAVMWWAEHLREWLNEGLKIRTKGEEKTDISVGQAELRMFENLQQCLAPFTTSTQAESDEKEIHEGRAQFTGAFDEALRNGLAVACHKDPTKGTPLFKSRASLLLHKLAPNASENEMQSFLGSMNLMDVCKSEENRDAIIMRFSALYDAMTAVTALENFAAGGFGDVPYDAKSVREVGLLDFANEKDWSDRYTDMVAKLRQSYPMDRLEMSGWQTLSDYLKEERHRRVMYVGGENSFSVRVIFKLGAVYSDLTPSNLSTEVISVERTHDTKTSGDRYIFRYYPPRRVTADGKGVVRLAAGRLDVAISPHPHRPGAKMVGAAVDFASDYYGVPKFVRTSGPNDQGSTEEKPSDH